MVRLRLSKNFWLHEFTFSETAIRLGREIVVPDEYIPKLRTLCETILEPLRADMGGRVITITSGYRPEWLNPMVGGSNSSQHTKAEAADFIVAGRSPVQVCRKIVELTLPFDQLILEFNRWTHVSIRMPPNIPRNAILTATKENGATVYRTGLHE